jgi:16S rRNA (guanine527-N7)-methyltransferase
VERATSDAAARIALESGLAELGAPDALLPRLEALSVLLARWAARLNLTAHRTAEAIARRLVLDALALGSVLPGAPPVSLADLGSGAGFPGLPLAILWPGCRVTLVESRERRHHFQRVAIRELGLSNATARLGRAEALEPNPHHVVVAQAVAQPEIAVQWMLSWAEPDGWIVVPQAEGQAAPDLARGVFHVETRAYQVPVDGPRRTAWMARRIAR